MIYLRHIPRPPLNRFVDHFWFYEGFFPNHTTERVLPDGCVELLIDLAGPRKKLFGGGRNAQCREFSGSWISGQQSSFLVIGTEQNSSMIGIHFRPGGVRRFLPFPSSELNNQVVDMSLVWGSEAIDLRDRILEAGTPQEKFSILDRQLWALLRKSPEMSSTSEVAVAQLVQAGEIPTIRELAAKMGLSQRQLLRHFDNDVGLGPKLLGRIFRFQKVLGRLEERHSVHWASLAHDCGYYDQSHFMKDFQRFTGLNPSHYLQDKGEFLNFVPIR